MIPAMLVGEALNRRADLQKRVAQLQERLRASALVREDDEPPESADDLMSELSSICDELQDLIARINHTNATVTLATGETVTEALARRDVLGLRQSSLRAAVRGATGEGSFGLRSSEVRMVRQISVKDYQKRADTLAKERRELDTLLQQHNWTAALTG